MSFPACSGQLGGVRAKAMGPQSFLDFVPSGDKNILRLPLGLPLHPHVFVMYKTRWQTDWFGLLSYFSALTVDTGTLSLALSLLFETFA